MIDATLLDVDIKPRETMWPLDPDVDLGASDVQSWLRTGDGLVPRQLGHPSIIKWRPLTLPEQGCIFSALKTGGGAASDEYSMSVLCVAYGLVSVEGLKLETEAAPTGRKLKALSVARFEKLAGNVDGLGYMSPIMWLGGLIAQASFRHGG
jgi:hypothetical protein